MPVKQNPKFEYLNPKQTGAKMNSKIRKSKTVNSIRPVWNIVFFDHLNLFRVSSFGFRILIRTA